MKEEAQSSLKKQLKEISNEYKKLYENIERRGYKGISIIKDEKEARKDDRDHLWEIGKNGLIKLGKIDKWWNMSKDYFLESIIFKKGIWFERPLLKEEENERLKLELKKIMGPLGLFLTRIEAAEVMEYLIRIIRINNLDIEILIPSIIINHNVEIFSKIIQTINHDVLENWKFIKKYEMVKIIPRKVIVENSIRDFSIIKKIYDHMMDLLFRKDLEEFSNIKILSYVSFFLTIFIENIKNLPLEKLETNYPHYIQMIIKIIIKNNELETKYLKEMEYTYFTMITVLLKKCGFIDPKLKLSESIILGIKKIFCPIDNEMAENIINSFKRLNINDNQIESKVNDLTHEKIKIIFAHKNKPVDAIIKELSILKIDKEYWKNNFSLLESLLKKYITKFNSLESCIEMIKCDLFKLYFEIQGNEQLKLMDNLRDLLERIENPKQLYDFFITMEPLLIKLDQIIPEIIIEMSFNKMVRKTKSFKLKFNNFIMESSLFDRIKDLKSCYIILEKVFNSPEVSNLNDLKLNDHIIVMLEVMVNWLKEKDLKLSTKSEIMRGIITFFLYLFKFDSLNDMNDLLLTTITIFLDLNFLKETSKLLKRYKNRNLIIYQILSNYIKDFDRNILNLNNLFSVLQTGKIILLEDLDQNYNSYLDFEMILSLFAFTNLEYLKMESINQIEKSISKSPIFKIIKEHRNIIEIGKFDNLFDQKIGNNLSIGLREFIEPLDWWIKKFQIPILSGNLEKVTIIEAITNYLKFLNQLILKKFNQLNIESYNLEFPLIIYQILEKENYNLKFTEFLKQYLKLCIKVCNLEKIENFFFECLKKESITIIIIFLEEIIENNLILDKIYSSIYHEYMKKDNLDNSIMAIIRIFLTSQKMEADLIIENLNSEKDQRKILNILYLIDEALNQKNLVNGFLLISPFLSMIETIENEEMSLIGQSIVQESIKICKKIILNLEERELNELKNCFNQISLISIIKRENLEENIKTNSLVLDLMLSIPFIDLNPVLDDLISILFSILKIGLKNDDPNNLELVLRGIKTLFSIYLPKQEADNNDEIKKDQIIQKFSSFYHDIKSEIRPIIYKELVKTISKSSSEIEIIFNITFNLQSQKVPTELDDKISQFLNYFPTILAIETIIYGWINLLINNFKIETVNYNFLKNKKIINNKKLQSSLIFLISFVQKNIKNLSKNYDLIDNLNGRINSLNNFLLNISDKLDENLNNSKRFKNSNIIDWNLINHKILQIIKELSNLDIK